MLFSQSQSDCCTTPPPSGQTLQLFSHFCVKHIDYYIDIYFLFLFFVITNQRYFCGVAWSKELYQRLLPTGGKTVFSLEFYLKGFYTCYQTLG